MHGPIEKRITSKSNDYYYAYIHFWKKRQRNIIP